MSERVAGVARAVAGWGLFGATRELPAAPLDGDEWRRLLYLAEKDRLTGLLSAAVTDGSLPTTEEQATEAREAHHEAMIGTLALERELVATVDLLTSADIALRVLKGPSLAHLDYPEPSLRPFGDIDLLVHRDSISALAGLLREHGYARAPNRAQSRSGESRGPSFRAPGGAEIDVHHSLVAGPVGALSSELWGPPEWVRIGGGEIPVLDRPARFLNVCYEAALARGTPRLGLLRDLAQVHLAQPLDADAVIDLAGRCQASAVVAYAVNGAWTALQLGDVTKLTTWARRYRPQAHERGLLAEHFESSRPLEARRGSRLRTRFSAWARSMPGRS